MGLTKPSSRLSKKGLQDVAITTPASFKGSSIPKKVPSHKAIGNKKAGIARAKASGRSNNVSTSPHRVSLHFSFDAERVYHRCHDDESAEH